MSRENYGKSYTPCLACGKVHGPVNALIRCLEDEILKLRSSDREKLAQRMESILASTEAFNKIPTTKGGMFEAQQAKKR